MKKKADRELVPEHERSFFQRNAAAIAVVTVIVLVIAAIIGVTTVIRRDAPKAPPAITMTDLPGPRNEISERSKYQVDTMVSDSEHAVAAFVVRYKYTKTQKLFLHTWTGTPEAKKVVDKIIAQLNARQTSATGKSSEEVRAENEKDPNFAARRLRNSEEARMGLIKCVPIAETALVYPELKTVATGICIATIPPFESNAKMAIIILTNSDMTKFSELAEMRRILLALQIDIYNRDFKGRETWAHP